MELNLGLSIFSGIFALFLQYAIIETAVKRGIDASETNNLLREFVKKTEENKE